MLIRPVLYSQTHPSDRWVCDHNLNRRPTVSVNVYIEGVLVPIDPFDIVADSPNRTIIKFSRPLAGEARFI